MSVVFLCDPWVLLDFVTQGLQEKLSLSEARKVWFLGLGKNVIVRIIFSLVIFFLFVVICLYPWRIWYGIWFWRECGDCRFAYCSLGDSEECFKKYCEGKHRHALYSCSVFFHLIIAILDWCDRICEDLIDFK